MKILKIKSCDDCSHGLAYYSDNEIDKYCDIKDLDIKDSRTIPEWCPLEDYKTSEHRKLIEELKAKPSPPEYSKVVDKHFFNLG